MSEPLDRARRVVATGACVLALVIVALAAAAWRLVETETADAAVRGRSAAALAVDDLVRALADRVDAQTAIVPRKDGSTRQPKPPRRFAPMPPLGDPEGALLIRDSECWSPGLRRAALRRALRSNDEATRLAAAAAGVRLEMRERADWGATWTWRDAPRPVVTFDDVFPGIPDPLADTRESVLLGLLPTRFHGGIDLIVSGFDATMALEFVGGGDDADAAAMIVAIVPDGVRLVRERRAAWNEASALSAAWATAREVDGASRAALFADGSGCAARALDGAWNLTRVAAPDVSAVAQRVLAPRLMRLVEADAATLPIAVPFPGDGGWSIAASFAESESRSRSTLLLAALAAAGLASVAAFAAFARSVRRDARLATLRTEFVATVSHELRTPVAVVRTSAETLAAGRATTEADRQALTTAIVRESERLSTLVGNVLDFARMEAGKCAYDLRETDVASLLRDVAARHPGVTYEVAADVPPLRCDADAIAGAVGNLLDNATKYGPPGALVTLRAVRRGDEVVIEVEDHGIGVPDAEKPHVFERFFRGADPKVKETRGAGIGLALVQHAARAHGGRVEIADTPGGGATFRIVLPPAQNGGR